MPVRGRVEGEAERFGAVSATAHAVRHHRLAGRVVLRVQVLDTARDRIAVGVRNVYAALPNPRPAKVAASAMSVRAAISSPLRTAARNDVESSDKAFSDHMSAIGLDPQYGTRCSGACARTAVYQRAV